MSIKFTKMHGCGNDYIYINCFNQEIKNPNELSIKLSDRRYGIGGDGIILICPSDVADAKMRMFNLDGSEGKMCGNGIRCVGKFLFDNQIVKNPNMTIETLSGIKNVTICQSNGKVSTVKVDMGKPEFSPSKIPVVLNSDKVLNYPIDVGEHRYNVNCVSMGNPHCVIFMEDVKSLKIKEVGKLFEHNKIFPEGVNTEVVEKLGNNLLSMRVWERGSGETLACGTGACASVVAAVENGLCKMGQDVTVKLLGGDLTVNYKDDTVYMTGNAEEVFKGEVEI